ncbi:redoxin domain-containing protein [Nesterenkonia lutea]|uniref:Alkyl hydroperoxide reductase subunit AhpC n=1 Tax=Nesterenkonia lutea TaxID=272919 RepID=A0ABR9JCU1_9MICC|nr:redoxin domain-containing protein [Nesterenkonia lutea]MBE1523749.1 alkyl hydroperoxide reductase subunit AhpC [Nesterenkonia lutea]
MTRAPLPVVGERAPDFLGRSHHGETVTLESLAGAPALLMFYPFAFSSVCGSELRALAARGGQLGETGATALAISCDPVHSLRAYAESLRPDDAELPFSLLSDFWPHGEIAGRYGAFDPVQGAAQRKSVLLDSELRVAHLQSVPAGQARDLDETLRVLARLHR